MDIATRIGVFFLKADKITLAILVLMTILTDAIRLSIFKDLKMSSNLNRFLFSTVINILLSASERLYNSFNIT